MIHKLKPLKNFNKQSNEQHPFHLVNPSPWPFMLALSLLNLALSFLLYFHYFKNGEYSLKVAFLFFLFFLYKWFKDIIIEATFEGHHTFKVQQGIKLGMVLFIISEVMFFFSFFWAYFHCSLSPSVAIGCVWPPLGINPIDPWALPLLNTIILLSSGITITWCHRACLSGSRKGVTDGLLATLALAIFFSLIQYYEYTTATFCINDGIYGSLFFVLTGFHGFHIIIGSIILAVCLVRHANYHFTTDQHVGLLCGIWYWHFVDVVWLLLWVIVYIWGGK